MADVRWGFSVAPAGELADPVVHLELARRAEDRGWDGWFVWDHLARPEPAVMKLGMVKRIGTGSGMDLSPRLQGITG